MIDTVIFDIGNVLAAFTWDQFVESFHFSEDLNKRITQATVKTPAWNEFDRGVLKSDEVIQLFIKNDPELEPQFQILFQNVKGTVTRLDYAIPWIKAIKARGYKVYVLSNFPERAHRDCKEALDFLDYVDGGIMSYQDKVVKPEPAIYKLLLDRYQLIPQNCVFLDDLPRNIEAAQKFGIHTILFKDFMQAKHDLDHMLTTEDNLAVYPVKLLNKSVCKSVTVPGSKSITNRALFMACMAEGESRLNGVLLSDDSESFLECLEKLGYKIDVNREQKSVTILGTGGVVPKKQATINVRSAGTTARFLTALLSLSDGEYEIECSEQMAKRPMKPLFDALEELGASITYRKTMNHLPVHISGCKGCTKKNEVTLDINESTQYLSALLMTGPIIQGGLKIVISSPKKTGAYIRITQEMMKQFGVDTVFGDGEYLIGKGMHYKCREYQIEPDVSAACYFYAAAALTGSSILVRDVHFTSLQGDIKFIQLLEKLGCTVIDEQEGIRITGRSDRQYKGMEVDMNDFSDQSLTLAAMAPFFTSKTVIRNIAHIRQQETNRIDAIVTQLSAMGIHAYATEEDIIIEPGMPQPYTVETYNDHRMAMAFSLIGLRAYGIVISNPQCCQKTFGDYFSVLDSLYLE